MKKPLFIVYLVIVGALAVYFGYGKYKVIKIVAGGIALIALIWLVQRIFFVK